MIIRPTRLLAPAIVALAAFAPLAGGAAAAATAPAPPPGLSISIDNGATTVGPDSDATYEMTVGNSGSEDVTAWVVATVPPGAETTEPGGGAVDGQDVSWKIEVPAGKESRRTFTVHVGEIPGDTYRVTVLASLFLTEDTTGVPVIRSADSDSIPGIAEPTTSPSAPADATSTASGGATGVVAVVAVVAIGGLALLVVFLRTRSRRATQPDDREDAVR